MMIERCIWEGKITSEWVNIQNDAVAVSKSKDRQASYISLCVNMLCGRSPAGNMTATLGPGMKLFRGGGA